MKDRNENRQGYKETKIGWIPDEWSDPELGTHMKCFSGGTPKSGMREFYNGDIPWIKSGELNQKNIYETDEFITEEAVKKSSAKFVESGTLLYALYGATAGVPGYTQIRATINQAVLAIMPNPKLNKHFCYFWFYSEKDRLIARYTQGGQPNLSGTIVKSFHIPLPPLPEQKAIAEVLGCWDEGIQSLESLIEQKRLRKKGLMQKLLTGGKRLPGFSDDWKELKLGEVLRQTEPYEKLEANTAYPLISIRRRAGGTFSRGSIPREDISYDQMAKVKPKDFLISKRQVSHGAYAMVSAKHVGCYVSSEYIILETTDNRLHMPFLEWLSKQPILWHKGYVSSNGVHIEKLILDPKHFLKHTILLPSLDEQKAIAEVLATADEEIQLLKDELDALREQKKGLMQKLLIGEIRHPDFRKAG